jgi:hypothetical protein
MREAANAVRDIGMGPLMAEAAAERQERLVDAMIEESLKYKELTPFSWIALAEMLSKASSPRAK